MKITFFCATGSADPVKASIPFHLGLNGSLANGDEVSFILGGDAADLIIGDAAGSVEGLGLPPMRELVDKLLEHRVPVYV